MTKSQSMWLFLSGLLLTALLFQNCDSSPSSDASDSSPSGSTGENSVSSCGSDGTLLGSCYDAGNGSEDARCTEYYNTDLGIDLEQECESSGDTWSSSECPGSITATCYTELISANYVALIHWYALNPDNLASAQLLCPTSDANQGYLIQFCSQ